MLSDIPDTSPALNQAIATFNQISADPYHLRSPQQIARFFDGLTLAAPGIVTISRWRPDPTDTSAQPGDLNALCGIGRKLAHSARGVTPGTVPTTAGQAHCGARRRELAACRRRLNTDPYSAGR